MTPEEMLAEQERKKGNRIYRQESHQLNQAVISELVTNAAEGLKSGERHRLTLADTNTLREIIFSYLTACSTAGTLPSLSGLAHVCGLTNHAITDYLRRNSETPSGQILTSFKELCSETLSDAALSNCANSIVAIFLLKANYGLVDHSALDINSPITDPLGPKSDPEEIARRYGYLPPADVEGDT